MSNLHLISTLKCVFMSFSASSITAPMRRKQTTKSHTITAVTKSSQHIRPSRRLKSWHLQRSATRFLQETSCKKIWICLLPFLPSFFPPVPPPLVHDRVVSFFFGFLSLLLSITYLWKRTIQTVITRESHFRRTIANLNFEMLKLIASNLKFLRLLDLSIQNRNIIFPRYTSRSRVLKKAWYFLQLFFY